MLKTWSFWKTFFTTYFTLVAGIWGVVQIYSFFREDELKQLFNSNWLIVFYIIPLFVAFLVGTLTGKEKTQAESLDQHNRRVMLNHVESFWIKGILEKSLYGAALLELGIKEDPTAINYPWTIKRESTNETLPAGKSMLEIFDEIGAGRSLLILGVPGSGKTTILLELARQLIKRARNDEAEPVPVVFNLASWTGSRTLADWLAEQLNVIYYVPKKTAPKWVSENKMLLLLDGLDEVKQEFRAKCVEAINQFRNEHGLTSLVVCSRIEEYQAINTKLSLEGAITLQPLTSRQVNAYFNKFGKSLTGVKELLKKDKALCELAETPLMLSIMTFAYSGKGSDELSALRDKDEQRKDLFNVYINRMFERPARTTILPFTKFQTLHYLSWLAQNMIRHNIVAYQIGIMQPSWLKNDEQHNYISMVRLLSGVIGGLIGGLTGWLIGEQLGYLIKNYLLLGLFFGFIGWYFIEVNTPNRQKRSREAILKWLTIGVISGLAGSLISILIYTLVNSYGISNIPAVIGDLMVFQVIDGLVVGLIGAGIGAASGAQIGAQLDEISMIDRLNWSWKVEGWLMFGLGSGVIGILIKRLLNFEIIGGQLGEWLGSWINELNNKQQEVYTSDEVRILTEKLRYAIVELYKAKGHLYGLVIKIILDSLLGIGLGVVLLVGLFLGLQSRQIEETTYPDQHLKQTIYNSIFISILSGLIFGSINLLINDQGQNAIFNALILGVIFGLLVGVRYGFITIIQHSSLRCVITKKDYLPKQTIPFLEHAADLIFLRRVGGSYIFVHRLLMEHFAEMTEDER